MEKCYGVITSYLSDLTSTVDGLSAYLDCDLRQLMSWVCLSYLPRASRCHEDADFSLSRCPVGSPLFFACTLSTMVRTWREEKERDNIGGWLAHSVAVYGVVGIRAEAGSLHPNEGVAARNSVIARRLVLAGSLQARDYRLPVPVR